MKVLVIGLGSIGKRYADILLKMGHEVYGDDVKQDMIPNEVKKYYGFESEQIEAVFICTPPSDHMVQVLKWSDKHLFIEKPVATDLSDVEDIEKDISKDKVNMVSCNMRYDPLIKKAYEELFMKETIGKILCVKTDFGYYLPDWRPGINLKDVEVPGIVLDSIHEIDLLMWMHGDPIATSRYQVRRSSRNAYGYPAVADILMVFGDKENPVLANIHMDYYRRKKKRVIEWIGDKGTITYVANRSLKNPNEANYLSINDRHHMNFYEHNEPYEAQVRDFFKAIKYNTTSPNPIDEAKDVLKVALEIQGGQG